MKLFCHQTSAAILKYNKVKKEKNLNPIASVINVESNPSSNRYMAIGNGTQLISSVVFPLKNWRLWHICLQNKIFVVISSSTAYNELEVSNLQTAVDMCQCILFQELNHFRLQKIFRVMGAGGVRRGWQEGALASLAPWPGKRVFFFYFFREK